jgi:hypothetical protein
MNGLKTMFPLTKVLSCTICQIAVYGWVSGKEGKDKGTKPTSYFVKHMLNKTPTGLELQAQLIRDAKSLNVDLFDSDFQTAIVQVIEWAKARPTDHDAESFDSVIKGLAYISEVNYRYIGHAVAMPKAYERSLSRTSSNSAHYGTLKDRVDVVVNDIAVRADKGNVPPHWWLISGKTDDGSVIKWFESKSPNTGFPVAVDGDTLKISGTVKAHEEWKGYKSTKLNRVVVLEVNGTVVATPKPDPVDPVPAVSSSDDNLPF